MIDLPEQIVSPFLQACHDVARRRLVRCSSGNLSLRLDAQQLLITASHTWMENVSTDDLCICSIDDGSLLAGNKPSVEVGFHAGIMRTRPEVNVVLHFQTPCATALASRDSQNINYFVIPEVPYYIGPVARIPYLAPGSEQLAQAVTDAMRKHDLVTISNHGQVTVAADFAQAIQNAEFFELACEIILHGADKIIPLPDEYANRLLTLRQATSNTTI
jgi:ribulose-5-phosphate 4-epimerase/fuculose-1-phosphate aldolase